MCASLHSDLACVLSLAISRVSHWHLTLSAATRAQCDNALLSAPCPNAEHKGTYAARSKGIDR
jgi:hypothetical protein